jgi:hypothetical protein
MVFLPILVMAGCMKGRGATDLRGGRNAGPRGLHDSPLEEAGFEPLAPRHTIKVRRSGTESAQTHRWRELNSNFRFRAR